MAPPLKKILCIDDEDDILQVTRLSLENVGGFTVTTCSSGPKGIQGIGDIKPDLILLDAMMPHMDGPTTLKELRKTSAAAHIPIVFMTARVQPAQIEEYKELGALGVITKPFDPMTLYKEVKALWEKFHGA